MIFNLKNPYEKESFKEYANKLYKAEEVVELKKKLPNRSLNQNAYLHVILSYFGVEYGCSMDEVKLDFFKRLCNKSLFERTITNKQGKEIKILRSSADLDSTEMTTAIERFRNWSSAVAGIYLPGPDEDSFILHIQQEIERNKEFI